MKSCRLVLGLYVLSALCFCRAGEPIALKASLDQNTIKIEVAGKLFTSYKFAPDQKYPYFWPVNGPASGKTVTTETSMPYHHHHSLFFGCDRVNGGNYWQEEMPGGKFSLPVPGSLFRKGRISCLPINVYGADREPNRSLRIPGRFSFMPPTKIRGSSIRPFA